MLPSSTKTLWAGASKHMKPTTYCAAASPATPSLLKSSTITLPSSSSPTVFAGLNQGQKSGILLQSKRAYAKYAQVSSDPFTPPDMSAYKKPPTPYGESDVGNRTYAYWMVGGMASLGALAGKNIVTDYLVHFAASADVLALATVEVELASIPVGKNIILKWRGKPVTIRHRSVGEIEEANGVAMSELRHQELDSDRTQNPEWLVMLAVCTHLGCVPIGEGWFCPCHGSHYDISGRIRKGPAPLNLEIPEYSFSEDATKLLIG